MEQKHKPKCPDCGSTEIRYRITTNDYWCRKCGCQWAKEETKADK